MFEIESHYVKTIFLNGNKVKKNQHFFIILCPKEQIQILTLTVSSLSLETIKRSPSKLRDFLSGRPDSNWRPLAPHASALPGCATSRTLLFTD